MQNFSWPSVSVTASNPSVGVDGSAIPLSSTLIGASQSGVLKPLLVDGSQNLLVSASIPGTVSVTQGTTPWGVSNAGTFAVQVTSSALPAGAATSANQTNGTQQTQIVQGGNSAVVKQMSTQVVSTDFGLVTNSVIHGLTTAGGGSYVDVKVNPSGALTVDASGSTISVTQGTSPWVVSNGGTFAVQAAQSGTWTVARSWTLASGTDSVSAVQSGTWNINNISGTISLPTGAATSALQTQISGQLPTTLGQKTMAASLAVVVASDQSALPVQSASGRSKANAPVVTNYSTTNVTSAAYVQIVASTAAQINMIELFDSSGQALYLAVGAAASEVDQLVIIPGGNGQVPISIPAGSRISYKAVSTSATSGMNILNMYS